MHVLKYPGLQDSRETCFKEASAAAVGNWQQSYYTEDRRKQAWLYCVATAELTVVWMASFTKAKEVPWNHNNLISQPYSNS